MGHQVDLGKAGGRDLPVLGPDRDVVLEEGAGPRAPVEVAELPFPLAEVPIDRPGADGLRATGGRGGATSEAPVGGGSRRESRPCGGTQGWRRTR
jgi:hypothetical protein